MHTNDPYGEFFEAHQIECGQESVGVTKNGHVMEKEIIIERENEENQ